MSVGQELFAGWIERMKMTRKEAAKYLGMHPSIVTKIAKGRRSPGRERAVMLYEQTGVPVSAWSDSADTSKILVHANGRKALKDK